MQFDGHIPSYHGRRGRSLGSEVDTVDRLQNKSMILIVYCIHLSLLHAMRALLSIHLNDTI
jgi:hypothetical protein